MIKSRAAALLLCAPAAWAHEGHGLPGSHWHASDAFGLLLVGGLGALVIYWLFGGK
ncbi:hypothetical protein [Ramlibacter sp. Leaf400]|uniref:hypothetical protein n=1 Tax=Ramlibacter sp. Leaf400 TaxID=1736365 RepID=UPI0012E38C8F|nr:hypothetical protein [Ramlibacter sp. Leaf400]